MSHSFFSFYFLTEQTFLKNVCWSHFVWILTLIFLWIKQLLMMFLLLIYLYLIILISLLFWWHCFRYILTSILPITIIWKWYLTRISNDCVRISWLIIFHWFILSSFLSSLTILFVISTLCLSFLTIWLASSRLIFCARAYIRNFERIRLKNLLKVISGHNLERALASWRLGM